jgi:hypothetical protein
MHGVSGVPWDVASVVETLVDFASAVRQVRPSEITAEDACMSIQMEMGARESMLLGGVRIDLPIRYDLEVERIERKALLDAYGVDMMDIDAAIDLIIARP